MSRLALYLLGSPRIELDGEEVHIGRRKAVALLAYLAVTGGSHSRDSLATLLWPEHDQSRARANLRRTLSVLNRTLGGEWLTADREIAGLNPDAGLWLDVDQFRSLLSAWQDHGHPEADICSECLDALAEAVELYQGDFLAGFTLRDSAAFDEWQFFETQGLRDGLASALERLVRCHTSQGEYELAIGYARRWLALDPLHEPAHRHLMALYAHAGQQSAALRQYQLCEETLLEELGLPPSEEAKALYEQIRTQPPDRAEPITPIPRARHNLPFQPTPFIGREEELVELDDLIADSHVRLVTIAGPGGMGKTRLAIAAAERQLEATEDGAPRFPQGAFFVPLAPLSSTEHIVPTVAEALSFPLRGEEGETRAPKQQVLDYLREKRLLLIMDNFGHLLDGANLVTDILQEAPDVQVLVTSRERLLLHEEQTYPIRGLEFPDWETPEDAAEYTAARLFLQSARRVQPDFELVADDSTYLTRICRLVEGMPLAVELAGSWVDMLSLADIAGEIQSNLDFLETEWRDVPARHRSIRAVFDASWQQMDPVEQAVFPQLSVFRGGFAREAAEQIGTTWDGSPASLRLLVRLANKSLLQYDRTQDRYDIHELLRQCGAEKLATDPEAEAAVRDRHSAYYCTALQRWEADLKGSRTQEALDKIDADIDNVRAAWEWAAGQGQVSQLDQAMDGLCLFYWQRYRLLEGVTACQLAADVLAQADPAATVSGDSGRVLARALAWQGFFYAWQWNKRLAEPLLRQSSDLLDSPALSDCDTRRERALLLWAMGEAAAPDWEQWRRAWERSVSLYRALGDQWWAATVLGWQGRIESIVSGDLETVRQKYEESLALFQALGHHRGTTEILLRLGELARETCDYDKAQRTFEEGLALSRAQGDLWGEALSLTLIGYLALFQGQFENGRDSLERAVEIRQQVGDRRQMAHDLGHCGAAHWLCGRFAEADSLLEQSLAIFEATGDTANKMGSITLQGEVRVWAGGYQEARALARTALALADSDVFGENTARVHRVLGWAALARNAYVEAQEWLSESVAGHREVGSQYAREWLAVTLPGAARAAIGLGNRAEAQAHLVEALEIVLDIRAYIPLLFLMPIIPVLLADVGEVERAVEIYGLAERHPFVSNSVLFEDIAGRHIETAAATLPPEVVEAAQSRGRARDMWATAAELLEELSKLDWC